MAASFLGYPYPTTIFGLCAIGGGTLLVIRLILQCFGIAEDFHLFNGEDMAHDHVHIEDSDVSFKLLSLQGISAFLTMFGLVGLAMEQAHMNEMLAGTAGLLAGLLTVWCLKKIFDGMGKLQSKGNLDLKNAVGAQGVVYLTISKEGHGKVQLTIQSRMLTLSAVAENDRIIPTGERIRVLKVVDGNTLVVEPVSLTASPPPS